MFGQKTPDWNDIYHHRARVLSMTLTGKMTVLGNPTGGSDYLRTFAVLPAIPPLG